MNVVKLEMNDIVIIIVLSLFANGCASFFARVKPVSNGRQKEFPLAVTITLIPTANEMLVGQEIYITAKVINNGFETITYARNQFQINIWKAEATRNGSPLPFSEQGRKALANAAVTSFSTAKMVHGDVISTTFNISELFDISTPGLYKFMISRRFLHMVDGVNEPFDLQASTTVSIK